VVERRLARAAALAAGFLFVTAIAFADPSMTARVSSNDIGVDDSLTLIIEISGVDNVGALPRFNFPDFQVQPAGQTSSFQWVNGQSSALVSFNYILTPLKTGTLEIPGITLAYQGKTLTTEPISVNVRAGASTAAPAAGGGNANVAIPTEGLRPVFLTAQTDRTKAYVGEQILLKVQFLHRPAARLSSQPRYSEPDTTGFLLEALPQKEFTTTLNGAQYQVTELPYILFPTSDGEYAIGSARLDVAVQADVDPFDPNSFFQSFFGGSRVLKLNTRAIPITVRSLPKTKPENFTGAVGRYRISAAVDAAELEVGKPFNLVVKVEGRGNVRTIKEPVFPDLPSVKRYETISTTTVNTAGNVFGGKKEFRALMIPQVSGELVIPPIRFSYFDPQNADFSTAETAEIRLQVKPGTLTPDTGITGAPHSDSPAEGVRVVEKDIRFLKSGRVHPVRGPLLSSGFFWAFNLVPPLFALGAFLTRRRSELRQTHAAHFRSREALRRAQKILKVARAQATSADATGFFASLHAALTNFLADKLDTAASGLTWPDLEREMIDRKIDPELRAALRELLDQADMARFAASNFTGEERLQSWQRANMVVAKLDKSL
jgi:hypothetical protein